jgi:hypothetical protein
MNVAFITESVEEKLCVQKKSLQTLIDGMSDVYKKEECVCVWGGGVQQTYNKILDILLILLVLVEK